MKEGSDEAEASRNETGSDQGRWTRLTFPLCALHLFTLSALAIANPIFEVTAKDAAFYVVRGSRPADLISLIAILCIALPLLLVAVEGVFRAIGRRVQLSVHFLFVAFLCALYAARLIKVLPPLQGPASLALAVAAGLAAAVLYATTDAFRRLVSLASPVIIAFPLLFVFGSQVGQIIKPGGFVWSNDGKTSHVYLKKKPPIVFVLLDELPVVSLLDGKGEIDAKRFPNLAQLAQNSHWFKNTTAVSAQTTNAVPAILTGIRPTKKLLPNLADHPNNLFTFLGDNYSFNVFESATYLCPPELAGSDHRELPYAARLELLLSDLSVLFLHVVSPSDYAAKLPSINNKWGNFVTGEKVAAGKQQSHGKGQEQAFTSQEGLLKHITERLGQDRTEIFHKMVANIKGDSRNTLNFVHVMLPHSPKEFLPSGKKYTLSDYVDGVTIDNDRYVGPQGLVNEYAQRHVLQMAYVDSLLGELLNKLKKEHLYDDSLIVLVADHGASYTAGDFNRRVSASNLADLMFVPLLIKLPGEKTAEKSDIDAETTDILPSIADLLGVKLPWKATGVSLFGPRRPVRPQKVILTEEGVSCQNSYDKLLAMKENSRAQYSRLFGLSDPSSTLYWFGKYRPLLGQKVSNLNMVKGDFHLTVEQTKLFDNVQLKSNFIPANVNGMVVSKPAGISRATVVVAINGTVQAVADTYNVKGTDYFSTIVPEAAFVQGKNEVRYYLLTADRQGRQALLSPDSQFQSYALEKDSIVAGTRRIPIIADAVDGTLDILDVKGRTAQLAGWAANVEERKPADGVVVFVAGKFAGEFLMSEERQDIRKVFKSPKLLRCGFDSTMPADLFKERQKVRAFAISNGVASELDYGKKLRLHCDYVSKLEHERQKYALEKATITRPGVEKLAIVPEKLAGAIDSLEKKAGKIVINGWGVDKEKQKPVEEILIFEGNRIVARGKPNAFRKDLGQSLKKKELCNAGFQFEFPASYIKDLTEVRLFAISGGVATELPSPRAAALKPASYRLEGGRLVSAKGEKVPVILRAVQGALEMVTKSSKGTIISGWAANVANTEPAECIVVAADTRVLGTGFPRVARPDVVKALHAPDLTYSGFNIALPSKDLKDPKELRVFAISRGLATELTGDQANAAKEKATSEGPAGPAYALSADGLLSPQGEQLAQSGAELAGSLDVVTRRADGVTISGWAANIVKKEPVEAIVLFQDGKFLAALAPNAARPDVSKGLKIPSIEYSGYEFNLPRNAAAAKLRVFAVSCKVAYELQNPETIPAEEGHARQADRVDPAPPITSSTSEPASEKKQ